MVLFGFFGKCVCLQLTPVQLLTGLNVIWTRGLCLALMVAGALKEAWGNMLLIQSRWIFLALLLATLMGCGKGFKLKVSDLASSEIGDSNLIVQTQDFGPAQAVLTSNCIGCHGNFTMSERQFIERGLIVPGDPAKSKLFGMLKGSGVGGREIMPLDRPPLSSEDLSIIREWIIAAQQLPPPPTATPAPPPTYQAVRFGVNNASGGTLYVNSTPITATTPLDFTMQVGLALTLEVQTKPGYRFTGFSDGNCSVGNQMTIVPAYQMNCIAQFSLQTAPTPTPSPSPNPNAQKIGVAVNSPVAGRLRIDNQSTTSTSLTFYPVLIGQIVTLSVDTNQDYEFIGFTDNTCRLGQTTIPNYQMNCVAQFRYNPPPDPTAEPGPVDETCSIKTTLGNFSATVPYFNIGACQSAFNERWVSLCEANPNSGFNYTLSLPSRGIVGSGFAFCVNGAPSGTPPATPEPTPEPTLPPEPIVTENCVILTSAGQTTTQVPYGNIGACQNSFNAYWAVLCQSYGNLTFNFTLDMPSRGRVGSGTQYCLDGNPSLTPQPTPVPTPTPTPEPEPEEPPAPTIELCYLNTSAGNTIVEVPIYNVGECQNAFNQHWVNICNSNANIGFSYTLTMYSMGQVGSGYAYCVNNQPSNSPPPQDPVPIDENCDPNFLAVYGICYPL
jgi:hypothetical protein